jgi:hypothetical protein
MRTLPWPRLSRHLSNSLSVRRHGSEVGEQPTQRLRTAHGQAWAKCAVQIKIHPLCGAGVRYDEVDEDVAGLDMAHTVLRIVRAAVVANKAIA